MIIMLAPMAGVTNRPFRLLCKEMGADIVYTEMVSARALAYNNKNTMRLLESDVNEIPIAAQFFGSEPELLAQAARLAQSLGFCEANVNMGCPVPKVVKNGEGCALMNNPALAYKIVQAMAKAVSIPITVKMRAGFGIDKNAPEFAKVCECAGASRLIVHGRTRSQFYAGRADWNIIGQVKQAVNIPVIANGDIAEPQDAHAVIDLTGCDGVMIGRAAMGNPWVFKKLKHFILAGCVLNAPSKREVYNVALRHCAMMSDKIVEMRKHVSWYVKGLENATRARAQINRAQTLCEMEEILTGLCGRADMFGEESPSFAGQGGR